MSRAIVCSLLLAVSAFAQRVTPEHILSGTIAHNFALPSPAAVWTGESFAVFWNDDAGLFAGTLGLDGELRRSMRIGDALDGVGGVAFDGSEILLLTNAVLDKRVIARRFTPSLESIGNATVVGEGWTSDVVWSGTEFVACWVTEFGSGSLVVAKLRGGEVVARRIITGTPAPRPYQVSIAATPTDVLLLWSNLVGCEGPPSVDPCIASAAIRALRFDAQLAALDPQTTIIAPYGYFPSVVSNGHEFLAAWTSGFALHTQRIHPSGALLGEPMTIDPLRRGTNLGVSVAWDGRRYFAVTQDYAGTSGGIFGASIEAPGAVAEPRILQLHTEATFYQGIATFAGPEGYFLVVYRKVDANREFRAFARVVDFHAQPRARSVRR